MKKFIYIGIMAILCGSCASQAPLDDAYYWPDKRGSQEATTESQEPSVESQEKMEIISQSDTTITVRIKR